MHAYTNTRQFQPQQSTGICSACFHKAPTIAELLHLECQCSAAECERQQVQCEVRELEGKIQGLREKTQAMEAAGDSQHTSGEQELTLEHLWDQVIRTKEYVVLHNPVQCMICGVVTCKITQLLQCLV